MDLGRMLAPRSIAVVGGGAWCASVLEQCRKIGFTGDLWAVHPKAGSVGGVACVASVEDLPGVPDAVFIGVNRHVTVDVVRSLSAMGAGGAVCFASGFLEAQAEDAAGADLQAALLDAAGDMPILGPNCYGFINYLDGACLWPDQHGGLPAETGVALITQSSNIAINLSMQARGVPFAYVVTAGNQAQMGVAEIGRALLRDERVSVLGLYIEGVGDLRAFEALAADARELGKSIVALKVGASEQARAAAVSHTASLAGGDAGADALLARLGIARVHDLATFLETLKLLHVTGPLPSNRIATLSCSGGEASLAADTAQGLDVEFPPLNKTQETALRAALGPMVALANPLDYHTYIWRDVPAMTATFAGMADPALAMIMIIADFPRADRCDPSDWDCVIESLKAAREETGAAMGLVASLPELLPEDVAADLLAAGIVPFCGLREALGSCAAAHIAAPRTTSPILLPTPDVRADMVPEAEAKGQLAKHGLRVPGAARCSSIDACVEVAQRIGFPVVLKGEGVAHKTEAGAVVLNIESETDLRKAAEVMPAEKFLVEEMITGTVAEVLIGVVKDPAHGFVLTLGAGGTLTEILSDTESLLIPVDEADMRSALMRLKIAPLLGGYRGADAADMDAILRAVQAVQDYVLAEATGLQEIEINPLICTKSDAIAADALILRKD